MGWMIRHSNKRSDKRFVFLRQNAKTAVVPTQPATKWVLGQSSQGMKLTTHLYLVPQLRQHGASSTGCCGGITFT
jgi:hypothetical protein